MCLPTPVAAYFAFASMPSRARAAKNLQRLLPLRVNVGAFGAMITYVFFVVRACIAWFGFVSERALIKRAYLRASRL